jgi:hypothetical protein
MGAREGWASANLVPGPCPRLRAEVQPGIEQILPVGWSLPRGQGAPGDAWPG